MPHAVPIPPTPDDVNRDPVVPERKPYTRPEIVHELHLETRAGGSLSSTTPGQMQLRNPFDPRPNR